MARRTASDTSRLIALFSASGLLLFNAGATLALWSWSRLLESAAGTDGSSSFDWRDETTILFIVSELGSRWTLFHTMDCLCGVYGAFFNKPKALRVFIFASTIDIAIFAFGWFLVALMTLSPVLSNTFGSLLCAELTRGEMFGFSGWFSESQKHAESTGRSLIGVEILSYGIESCEDHWRPVVALFLAIGLVGWAVRVWTVATTRRYVRRLEAREAYDQLDSRPSSINEKPLGSPRLSRPTVRGRSRSANSAATTLPLYSQLHASASSELVLVPVMYSPSSPTSRTSFFNASPPASPRSVSPSASSSSSSSHSSPSQANRSRRSHNKRRTSAPPAPDTTNGSTTNSYEERTARTRTKSDGWTINENIV